MPKMALVPFDERDGWIRLDGAFVPRRDASLHLLAHGLHNASAVLDGERAHGGPMVRPGEHAERLIASGRIPGFGIPWSAARIAP